MKKLVVVLFILPFTVFSQSRSSNIQDPANLDSILFELTSKTLAPKDISLPFNKIEVLDARFDTSKLGFVIDKKSGSINSGDFKKIKLNGGISKAMQDYYNDYYQLCLNNQKNELLIVLKTLWIDNLPTGEFKVKRRFDIIRESYQDIYVKFEYYLKSGKEYYPLKRVDTVYQLTDENINSRAFNFKRNDLSFFTFTLKSLIENYDFNELLNKVDVALSLTLNSIDSFNNKRFQLPVLNFKNIKHGIFLSVTDFINNSPLTDTTNYTFDKKGNLYKNGDKKNAIFYWIISDGSGLYTKPLKKAGIIRTGKTFEFFMFNDIYMSKTAAGNLLGLIPNTTFPTTDGFGQNQFNTGNGARLRYVLAPRQINMETGEIY